PGRHARDQEGGRRGEGDRGDAVLRHPRRGAGRRLTMGAADMPKKLGSELERIVLERIANNRLVLPAMPSVPQRCLDILRDPDFNVRKLVKELEAEPVLALLVVRAANAPTYGRANSPHPLAH